MPKVYKNVSSLFKKRGTGTGSHIDNINDQFEAIINEIIHHNDPEIREYEEKVGLKMKGLVGLAITTNSARGVALDVGNYRMCGSSTDTYLAAGLTSRSDFVGRCIGDIGCLRTSEWKRAADELIQDRWPDLGLVTAHLRHMDDESRIPRVGCTTPLIVDGKICLFGFSVPCKLAQSNKWPDARERSEIECAVRLISIFKDKIAHSNSVRKLDYPRKYVWHSSLFTVKNTFLDFVTPDDEENLQAIRPCDPSLWGHNESCSRKRSIGNAMRPEQTIDLMNFPKATLLDIARLCKDPQLKTKPSRCVNPCNFPCDPSYLSLPKKEWNVDKSRLSNDMISSLSYREVDNNSSAQPDVFIPNWQGTGFAEYGHHSDPGLPPRSGCYDNWERRVIHAPTGEKTEHAGIPAKVCCSLISRWDTRRHRAKSLPMMEPFSQCHQATQGVEEHLYSFEGEQYHHDNHDHSKEHVHTQQCAAAAVPPTQHTPEDKYWSEVANAHPQHGKQVAPSNSDEYAWRTSTYGHQEENKLACPHGTLSVCPHTSVSFKEYKSTNTFPAEATLELLSSPWANSQEFLHPQSKPTSSSSEPPGFVSRTTGSPGMKIDQKEHTTSMDPNSSNTPPTRWGMYSYASPPSHDQEHWRRVRAEEYHRAAAHGSSMSAAATGEPMEHSSSSSAHVSAADPSSYMVSYIGGEKTLCAALPTQLDEEGTRQKRQPVLPRHHQKVNATSSTSPPSALREHENGRTAKEEEEAVTAFVGGALSTDLSGHQEPRHRGGGSRREEHHQNGQPMPIRNESMPIVGSRAAPPHVVKPIGNTKKKQKQKKCIHFQPGDRVELHSFETTHWLEGLTCTVGKVMSEKRSNGGSRVRVQIFYDDVTLQHKENYPSTLPQRNLRRFEQKPV